MRSPIKVALTLALVGAVLQTDVRAHHNTTHDQNPLPPAKLLSVDVFSFPAGSIIIPMDSCYARPSFMNNTELDKIVKTTYESAAANRTNKVCRSNAESDDGIIPAYSLIQRLVRDGIRVHWAIKGNKTSFHDWDVKISKVGGGPVQYMTRLGVQDNRYSGLVEIRYPGAPFIIDGADAASAKALMASYAAAYDVVDFHVAQVPFTAPVYSTLAGLPKMAIIDVDDGATALQSPKTNQMIQSVSDALMTDMEMPAAGSWWDFVTIPEVMADRLTLENFEMIWVPGFDLNAGGPTVAQIAFFNKLAAFADAGGHILFQDGAIGVMEGHGTFAGVYTQAAGGAPNVAYQTDSGILANGVSSVWDNCNGTELTTGSDFSDPAAQFGGMCWTGIGGSKASWQPRTDRAYLPGVRRMIFSDHATDDTKRRWDFASWRYKDNDQAKGVIYYLGGDNWRATTAAGFRVMMNTIFVHAFNAKNMREISRGSPIFANIGGIDSIVQGTFEQSFSSVVATQLTTPAEAATFRFPAVLGHMRAIRTTGINTTGASFTTLDSAKLFDAATGIPSPNFAAGCGQPYNSSCRGVFTSLETGNGGGNGIDPVQLTSATVATLGPVMAPTLTATEWDVLLQRTLAGIEQTPGVFVPKLGGVDRSTVAVIPPSGVAQTVLPEQPASSRPTMVYFGATDGMLHAVCATTGGGCDVAGRELWAYLPRVNLPRVARNTARIDGSPRVMDLFGDFNADGKREFRTILLFQTGTGDATKPAEYPAVYALDVTDPQRPKVLWEYTRSDDPTAVAALPEVGDDYDHGPGLVTAAGRVRIGTADKNLAFVQTANGGALATSNNGSVVTALDIETGAFVWQHEYGYPAPRDSANQIIPLSGMPGGVVAVDKQGNGRVTDLVFGTLYGDVWLLDPTTGQNRHGANPLLRFATDFHPIGAPPTVFTLSGAPGSTQFAVFGTGGFADPLGDSWSASSNQFGFTVSLDTPTAATPLVPPEPALGVLDTSGAPNVRSAYGFGNSEVFAQALVVGDDIFFVTDDTNVNSTSYGTGASSGKAYRLDLATSVVTQQTISGGASSLANNGSTLYAGSADKLQQLGAGMAATGTGFSVDGLGTPKLTRKLWLITL